VGVARNNTNTIVLKIRKLSTFKSPRHSVQFLANNILLEEEIDIGQVFPAARFNYGVLSDEINACLKG